MQRKAVAVVALVLAVVYAGLLGMGAYLQYESGRLFDQMWTSEEGRALEAEYRQTAWRSEQLKWVPAGHWDTWPWPQAYGWCWPNG